MILSLEPVPPEELALDLDLDLARPIVLGTQHPVTTEAGDAARQMTETLAALSALGMQTVFTYPNTDAGGAEMVRVLQSYAGRPFLRAVPHLGSRRYLSLMRIAAVMVGNSSSGILEAASFRLPAVNVGTRQHGRTRACNVIDVGYDRDAIVKAVRFALSDPEFRAALAGCVNPYGDGNTAARTVDVLRRLRLTPALWRNGCRQTGRCSARAPTDWRASVDAIRRRPGDGQAGSGPTWCGGCPPRAARSAFPAASTASSTGTTYGHEPLLAYAAEGANFVIQPFVRRRLNALPFLAEQGVAEPFWDIANAYGYGGPLCADPAAAGAPDLLAGFEEQFGAWCREQAHRGRVLLAASAPRQPRARSRRGRAWKPRPQKRVVYLDLTRTEDGAVARGQSRPPQQHPAGAPAAACASSRSRPMRPTSPSSSACTR